MRTLTSEKSRFDLAESVGPDLLLGDLFEPGEIETMAQLSLEYRSAEGSTELRKLIARQHSVHESDVITTVGGMHAIFLCSTVLCNSGDHVLVQKPSFPLTQSALAFNKAELEFIPCRFDDQYQIDVDHLISTLRAETTLVCIASPQNPSGVAMPQVDIEKILNAMQQRSPKAFLLLDETYRQASYGCNQPIESLASIDERIISCASLSKCHGTPGLRVGWAITRHQQLRNQLINGKFQTVICSSVLDEAVAVRVLEHSESLFADRRTFLLNGRAIVSDWVEKHSDKVSWVSPDAGALCCVRFEFLNSDSERLSQFQFELQQRSVRLAPGSWFGDEPEVFRLGFGLLPLAELREALETISDVIKKLA